MMYVAFLLLTVSTLPVHGKPRGGPDDCVKMGEWTYCKKPDRYPQSQIDQSIAETYKNGLIPLNMGAHLINMPDLEDGSVEGNCAMDIIPSFTPYTMKKGKKMNYIVQSKLFNQSIPIVKCSGKNERDASLASQKGDDEYCECFKDLIPAENTKCMQRTITISLYIYIGNAIGMVDAPIYSDCVCAKPARE